MSTPTEYQRVAAELAALRAGVEALADEWQATYLRWEGVSDGPRVSIHRAHSNRLRNLLEARA